MIFSFKNFKQLMTQWLAIWMSISPLCFAEVSIPDDINVEKYERLYLQAKEDSDQKRNRATSVWQQAVETDKNLSNSRSQLAHNQSQIQSFDTQIPALESENNELLRENDQLGIQLIKIRQDIADVDRHILNLQQQRDRVSIQLNSESQKLAHLENQLNDTSRQLTQVTQTINENQRKLDFNRQKMQENQQKINSNTARLNEVESLSRQLKMDLPNQEAQLRQAQVAVNEAQTLRIQAEQDVQTREKEIAPLRAQWDEAKKRVDLATQKVASAEAKVTHLNQSLASYQQELSQLESRLNKTQSEKNKVELEIAAIPGQISNLNEQIHQIQQRNTEIKNHLAKLEGEISEVQKALAELNSEKNKLQTQLREIEGQPESTEKKEKIAKLKAKIEEVSKRINEKQSALEARTRKESELKNALNANDHQIQLIQTNIAQKQQNLTNLNAQLAEINRTLSELPSKITDVKGSISKIQHELLTANLEVKVAQEEKNEATAAVSNIKAKLDPMEQGLGQARKNLAEKTNLYNQAVNLHKQQEQKVNNMQNRIHELIAEKGQIEGRLQTLGQEQGRMEIENKRMSEENSVLVERQTRLKNQEQSIRQAYSNQNQVVNQLRSRFDLIQRELSQSKSHRQELANLEINLSNRINHNLRRIDANKQQIAWMQSEISRMRTENQQLAVTISNLESVSQRLWGEFNVLDNEAKMAEAITAQKLADLNRVRKQYETELQAAIEKGRSQGVQLGESAGRIQGNEEGKKQGSHDGAVLGREQGLKYGYEQGLKIGGQKGKEDGYNHGYNAPENYQTGYKMGSDQGIRNAQEKADKELYPNFVEAYKEVLFKDVPHRQQELEVAPALSYSLAPYSKLQLVAKNHLAKQSAMNIHQSQALSLAKATWGHSVTNLSGEFIAESGLMKNNVQLKLSPNEQVDCNLRYIDFVNACKEAFTKAYNSSYEQSYARAYKASYDLAKEDARVAAFEANKSVRYKEGFDLAYQREFANWDAVGAEKAKAEGYSKGLKDGYDSTIEAATQAAQIRAKTDTDTYFANHPVIRVREAQFIKINSTSGVGNDIVVAGDTLALKMNLTNFGQKPSPAGSVDVKVEALTKNIQIIQNSNYQVPAIPERTQGILNRVAYAKIPVEAGNGLAQIKVTTRTPDGFKDERIIDIKTMLFIFAKVTKQMNLTPSAPWWWSRTERIELKVRNSTPHDSEQPFRAVLSIPQIEGLNPGTHTVELGHINAGEEKTAQLSYIISSKAAGKTFDATLTVYYGSFKSWSETVRISVK